MNAPATATWTATREASFQPSTVDEEARTVELVWTTGATVRRRPFFSGEFDEELVVSKEAVRLDRLNGGAPLLDSHHSFGLDGIVGVVERAWLQGSEGRAKVRFSDRADVEPVFRDVKAGIIRNVSVGYAIHRVQRTDRKDQVPLVRVIDWEPMELSLVPVPADAGAQVRSYEDRNMDRDTTVPVTEPAANRDPSPGIPAGGALAERERVLGITQAGRTLHMERQAAQMVERGITLEAAQTALLTAAAERDEADQIAGNGHASVRGGFSGDDPEQLRAAMADALSARICRTPPPDHARQWASCGLLDLMYESCRAAGQRVDRRNVDTLLRAGLHTTSDFALLLADAQNKALVTMYQAAPSGIRAAARQTTARDFKTVHRLQSGEFPLPVEVGEHGEFTRGTMGENDETYSLSTYGRIFGISRRAIINDDMSVFSQVTQKMAVATAEFVAAQLAALVANNPVMSDGTVVFHANHGNLQSAGSVDVAGLSAARAAMRAQKGLDGEVYVRADPRFIIVPPDLETSAEQVVATITAADVAEVNPFSGRLAPLVEPRLASGNWYLAADPAQIDGLEYAFLDGAEGPQTETRVGFDVDGIEHKLRVDFGAGWLDYRAWQKTPTS